MTLKERLQEAGVALTAFAVFQSLACLASVLVALLSVVLMGITSLAAAEDPDAGRVAIELLWEAVASAANAAALLYCLRLLYLKHPATRRFWTIYLGLSILLYGYYVLRGDSGCTSVFPMVANLGWLVYWLYSRRIVRLYP